MPYTQEGRICRIESPLGKDALILHRMSGVEEISSLFRFQLDLVSARDDLEFEKIVGDALTVGMLLPNGEERFFHGIVSRFAQGGTYVAGEGEDRGLVCYEATVVPWLWYLTRVSNSRVFEKKTVVDILKKVFDDLRFTDYEFASLSNQYDEIDYCVQYAETDFNFVSRLMEQWGLAYAFRHENGKHTLVIFDTSATRPDCPVDATVVYAGASAKSRGENEVDEWSVSQEMPPGRYALNDYNFETPSTDLAVPTQTKLGMAGNAGFEIYEYPGEYGNEASGKQFVKFRMEAEEAASHEVQSRGSSGAFTAGTHITLEGHFRESFNNKRYLLTRVHHSVSQGVGNESYPSIYENSFACLPERILYRPVRRTLKPTIHGIQTALVVGPSGEEIHCDKYGRIRIQFHWDRYGKADGTNVCWARVAQGSAGKRWGTIFTPRIGQEVVVTFLEGDPDHPLVTGVVYNAEQMPPYELDANKTKSGFKTRSSKASGAAGGNEIRFEDLKGEEQIFLHAEKNVDLRVKKDRFEWIGEDTHLVVKKDQYEKIENERHTKVAADDITEIGKDRHLKVAGKEAIEVAGSHSFTVTGDVIEVFKANHSEQTTQNLYVKAMGVVIESMTGVTIKTGGSSVVIDPSGVTLKGPMVTIDGSMVRIASGPGSPAMSGQAGNAVAPIAPTPPEEADKPDPGEMAQVKAKQRQSGTGKYGAPKIQPFKPPTDETEKAKKSWIEIELVDEEGNPVPGEQYEVTLPDGTTVAKGTLDQNGFARIDGIDPGTCKITFPRLDKDAWEPA